MRNVVIQLHPGEYQDFVRYLSALEFEGIVLRTPVRRVKTLGQLLGQYFAGACQLLGHLRSLRPVRTVIVFSHFALVVKLFARLGLVRYQRLFCFGLFLHNPRWFRWFRWLRRLDGANDHYIIFSESELLLYRAELGIETARFHYIPLGDLGTDPCQPAVGATLHMGHVTTTLQAGGAIAIMLLWWRCSAPSQRNC